MGYSKIKSRIGTVILFAVLLAATGCSVDNTKSGDTIVPPVASGPAMDAPKSSGSLNNLSNMTPLAQPSANMVYTLLNNENPPVSIFADNKYLYILRGSGKANTTADTTSDTAKKSLERYGNVIEVYDVDNGSLVRKISDKRLAGCSAFTVKDSNLYAYSNETGRILLFSSAGSFLSAYDTKLSGVYTDKLLIADNGNIVLRLREAGGGNPQIAVFKPDTSSISRFESYKLSSSQYSNIPEIIDFCPYDENSVLIGLSGRELSLFDIEKGKVEKSCVFPMNAGFMEFDGNVLYYAADEALALSPGNTANFSNVSGRRQTGRLLINNEFNWPKTEKELDAFLMGGLQMTGADNNGRHCGMAENTKYLFFLDFISGEESGKQQFKVYRIAK